MSDPYYPLIHHLMGMMDSSYHAPFAVDSCLDGLFQASIFVFPVRAKYGSLSLNGSSLYAQCGMTLP